MTRPKELEALQWWCWQKSLDDKERSRIALSLMILLWIVKVVMEFCDRTSNDWEGDKLIEIENKGASLQWLFLFLLFTLTIHVELAKQWVLLNEHVTSYPINLIQTMVMSFSSNLWAIMWTSRGCKRCWGDFTSTCFPTPTAGNRVHSWVKCQEAQLRHGNFNALFPAPIQQ